MAAFSVPASSSSQGASSFAASSMDQGSLLQSCQDKQALFIQRAKSLETAFKAHAAQPSPSTQSNFNQSATAYLESHEQLVKEIGAYRAFSAAHAEQMERAVGQIDHIVQTKILTPEKSETTAQDLIHELSQQNQKYLSHIAKIDELLDRPELAQIHYGFYLDSLASQKKTIHDLLLLADHSPIPASFSATAHRHLEQIENYHQQFSTFIKGKLPKIKNTLNLAFNLKTCSSLPALSKLYTEATKNYSDHIKAINLASKEKNTPAIIENYDQLHQIQDFRKKILERILELTQNTIENKSGPFYKAQMELEKTIKYHNTAINTLLTEFPIIALSIDYGTRMASSVSRWNSQEIAFFTKNPKWEPAFLALQHEYPFRTVIAGDGNCFYTSLLLAYLSCPDHIAHFWNLINEAPDEISSKPLARHILTPLVSDPPQHIDWTDHRNILPLVHFTRQIIALNLKQNPASFEWDANYDQLSPEEYLKKRILQMGTFSRAPAIEMAGRLLNFPFQIMNFDDIHETVDETGTVSPEISTHPQGSSSEPKATLIIKGNHYFILYKSDPTPVKDLLQFV